MPIRYLQPFANPMKGIDVDYFDRKALERQSRHDKARALWTEETKTIANQSYGDQASRDQFLKERDAMFEGVIDSNAGNLSKGFHDVLGAVEKASLHQYHNLNKRQQDQMALQQAADIKYGAEHIDLSNGLKDPLYDGEQWRDPSSVQYQGMKASPYQDILGKQLNKIAAEIRSGQSNLSPSSNAYYLLSNVQSIEELSPTQLMQLANDPAIQQAFLANAPSALQDNREFKPGMMYKDMFGNSEELGKYIYGNIADEQRYKEVNQTKFVTNQAKLYQDKIKLQNNAKANAKAIEDYKLKIKKVASDPSYKSPHSKAELTKQSLKQIKDQSELLTSQNRILLGEQGEVSESLKEIIDPNSFGVYNTFDFYDPNTQSLSMEKIKTAIANKGGVEDVDQAAKDAYIALNRLSDIDVDVFNNGIALKNYENIETEIDNVTYKKYYDNLVKSSAKESVLKNNDINSYEDFLKIAKETDGNWLKQYINKAVAFLGTANPIADVEKISYYRMIDDAIDDKEKKVNDNKIELEKIYNTVHNINDESAINRFNKGIEKSLNGADGANMNNILSSIIDETTGIPISESKAYTTESDKIVKNRKGSINLVDNAKGFKTVAVNITGTDAGGNDVLYSTVGSLAGNNNYSTTFALDYLTEKLQTDGDIQGKNDALVYYGQTLYSDQNERAFGAVLTGKNKAVTQSKVKLKDGTIGIKPIYIERIQSELPGFSSMPMYRAYIEVGNEQVEIANNTSLDVVRNNVEYKQGVMAGLVDVKQTDLRYLTKGNKKQTQESIYK